MTSKGPDYTGSMHIGIISDLHLDLNQVDTFKEQRLRNIFFQIRIAIV